MQRSMETPVNHTCTWLKFLKYCVYFAKNRHEKSSFTYSTQVKSVGAFSEESYIFKSLGVWGSSGSEFLFNINVPCKIDVTAARPLCAGFKV